MSKNDIVFLAVCVVAVATILGVYTYNKQSYESISVMQVVQLEDTHSNITEYSIYKETTIPTTIAYTSLFITAPTSATAPPITKILSTIANTTTLFSTSPVNTTNTTYTTITTTKNTTIKDTTTQLVVNFPISLNYITHDELVCIKGIGDTIANKIIAYREQIGYFISRYQLLEIDGIGESRMNTIMQYTYIENEDLNYGQEVSQNNYQEETKNVDNNSNNYSPENYPKDTDYYPLDLNTATFEELSNVPNLNEVLAQDIINLRQNIGQFSNTYELLYVDGISESTLTQLEEYIYVQ